LNNNDGGTLQVFNSVDFFTKLEEFRAKTMQEFQQELYSVMENSQIYGYLCENTTDYAVVEQYDMETSVWGYYKYNIITNEQGQLSLENPVPVRARFLTEEECNSLDAPQEPVFAAAAEDDEEKKKLEDENSSCAVKDDEDKKDDKEVDESAEEEKSEPENDDDEKTKKKDEVGNATAGVSASALSDEEKRELDSYRRAAKVAIIDSYAADLDENTLNQYRAQIDTLQASEIEANLAIAFRKVAKEKIAEETATKTVVTFANIAPAENYNENSPADVIKKYNKNKNN
jgi:stringent starvation protein B